MFLIQSIFAQTVETITEPSSWDEAFKLLEYLFNNAKGLGMFGIILVVTQIAMFILNKTALAEHIDGKIKVVAVAFFTLLLSICSVGLSKPDFGVWSILFSSVVLTALQSFGYSIYKEFFKKAD